jgi:tRNA A37 threonylcarbamoyladenosine dehydratase
MERLKRATVAVFGLGGVGSWAAEFLARAGIGRLLLIDNDCVVPSNLNRQMPALSSTIGEYKAVVVAQRIRDINPAVEAISICARYTPETREHFFNEHMDYIIDAIDSVDCKLDLIVTALGRGVPIISSMGAANKLDPSGFIITDIAKTEVCPLAKKIRLELRKRGVNHHEVIYSRQSPVKPHGDGAVPLGSVPWVPPVAGIMLAGHTAMKIAGIKPD